MPFLGKVLESKLNNKARKTRTKGEKIPGTLTALVVYSFSLKRYLNHYRMQHALEAGVTVVTDRYPQAEIPGICDGPGLSAARPGNRFVAWLARSEARMYRHMASCHPNLIIRLDVSPAVAHARRPDHDLRLLELKGEAMKALSFDGAPLISVNAAEPFETVWKIVSSRAQSLLITDLIGCRREEVPSYI